jgi:hypothetical protein
MNITKKGPPKGSRNAAKHEAAKVSGKGRIVVDIGDELKAKIELLADSRGVSLKSVVVDALRNYFENNQK